MAKFRQVFTNFWTDPMVMEEMTPEDKFFMLYLLTNSSTTQIGVYRKTKKEMAFEMGYSIESINSLIHRFEHIHKTIKYNPDTRELAIKNWGKYNFFKGGKPIYDLMASEMRNIEDVTLLAYVVESYIGSATKINNEIVNMFVAFLKKNNISINVTSDDTSTNRTTVGGQDIDIDIDIDKDIYINNKEYDEIPPPSDYELDQTSELKFAHDSMQYRLADFLKKHIARNFPDAKLPNDEKSIQKWCIHIDRLIRLDKRTPEDIKAVIKYSQNDKFWSSNILSTKKLREKFDTLLIQLKAKGKAPTTGNSCSESNPEVEELIKSNKMY